jgi:hypothetical protein
MATSEIEEPRLPNDNPVVIVSRKMLQAAGTDERLSLRALLGLALTGGCVVLAPLPFNIIGAVAAVITAIEVARLAWHK